MENRIEKYKVILPIKFTIFKRDDIITKNNGKFYFNNELIPWLVDEVLGRYCRKLDSYKRQIENGRLVVIKLKYDNDVKGKVEDFDEENGLYKVTYTLKSRKHSRWFAIDELAVSTKYYFLSSKGIIQDDYTYRDEQVERWRKLVGNFFQTKEECERYRNELIEKSK